MNETLNQWQCLLPTLDGQDLWVLGAETQDQAVSKVAAWCHSADRIGTDGKAIEFAVAPFCEDPNWQWFKVRARVEFDIEHLKKPE